MKNILILLEILFFFIQASQEYQIGYIQEPLLVYRIHNNNFTSKNLKLYINELSLWIKENERLESVLEIARRINGIEGFTLENKKTFLSDIRDIAVADGRFNSDEKHLHDRIAKELGINMMTIDKNIRKKLGY